MGPDQFVLFTMLGHPRGDETKFLSVREAKWVMGGTKSATSAEAAIGVPAPAGMIWHVIVNYPASVVTARLAVLP